MTNRRWLTLVLRLVFSGFFLATAVYALMASVAFSYQQFLRHDLFPGLALFVRLHPYVYWVGFGAGVLSILPDIQRRQTRRLALAFVVTGTATGAALIWHPLLPTLKSDAITLAVSVAALVPLLWIAALDHISHGRHISTSDLEGRRNAFWAAIASAVGLSVLYAGIACTRMAIEGAPTMRPTELIVAASWSLVLHLILFMTVCLVLDLIRTLSRLSRRPVLMEACLTAVWSVGLIATAVYKLGLAAISFSGPLAMLVAGVFALSIVAVVSGLALRVRPTDRLLNDGVEVLVGPLLAARLDLWRVRCVWLAAVGALAAFLALRVAPMDWNFLLQKLSVLCVWALTFASCYLASRATATSRRMPALLLVVALMSVGGYKALEASRSRVPGVLRDPQLNVAKVLDRYAGYDVSFKILYDLASQPTSSTDQSFYSYLQRNTNIPHDTVIQPVSVDLVPNLTSAPGPKPDIYLIVVDSLRRDYLSPYNPRVTFTPAIEQFAHESRVFTNAFTHYGATGLSEPSIWTGGLLVHQQYVTPFYPMNTLAKLLDVERYRNFVSKDAILRSILPRELDTIELDQNIPNKDYDLCRSLTDLQGKLDTAPASDRPVFAYTQPQNLHVSRINREEAGVPAGEAYPGFHAPYAARLKQIDGCFGRFIQYLKVRGRYDRSIVIVTSDHGDSLGESGRWGHAYTLFPEVVRIPLLIHAPASLQSQLANPSTLAFSTDITPTVYALTGHPVEPSSRVLGRPLLRQAAVTSGDAADWNLLVSSYGPVYGILRGNGRWLYIVDAVNYRDYYYDLDVDAAGERNLVTPSIRREQQALVREGVRDINRFYKMAESFEQ